MKTLFQFICEAKNNQSPAKYVFDEIEKNLDKFNITKTNANFRRTNHKQEVMIANYGDDIEDTIEKLLLKSGFKKREFKIGEQKVWGRDGFDTSSSKVSLRVDFKIDGKNEPLFFCVGSDTNAYLSKGYNGLTPGGLNITSDDEFSTTDEIMNSIKKNLDDSLPEGAKKDQTKQFILDILDAIDNYSFIKTNDFTNISKKIEVPLKSKATLDPTSMNTLQTTFGEVLSGLVFCNSLSDSKIMFPDDHSYAINDFLLYGSEEHPLVGVSVKKGGSVSHAPEFDMILKMFMKKNSMNDKIDNLEGEDKELMDNFMKNLAPIFTLEDRGKRESILWNLSFKLFEKDELEPAGEGSLGNYFKQLIKFLGINSSMSISDIHSQVIETLNDPKNYNQYLKTILNPVLSIIGGLKGPQDPWIEDATGKNETKNYSKVMHLLQFMIVEELNKYYKKPMNIISQIVLGGLQVYVDINISKDMMSFKTISLNEQDYSFSCIGATWNEWSSHGSLMIRPEK